MKTMLTLKALFVFSLAGVLFSGYLSAVKLLTKTCAFNESCPYFLGYPACWYGFLMFLSIFVSVCLGLFKKINRDAALKIVLIISALGIVFAGSFVSQELSQKSLTGSLGLSTCAYGLIFYILIFVLASRKPLFISGKRKGF